MPVNEYDCYEIWQILNIDINNNTCLVNMPPLDVAEIIIKSMAFPKATVILLRACRTAFIEVGAYFPNKRLVTS